MSVHNYSRVTVAVLDEVIRRLQALRADDRFDGEILSWNLCDCAAALTGTVPADGDGFSFTAEWARQDFSRDGGPVPIPLPPEPPRDRIIEAVDADGTVVDRWWWDRDSWRCQGLYSRCPDGSWAFVEIAAEADSNGWSLRHVPAEGGEKP